MIKRICIEYCRNTYFTKKMWTSSCVIDLPARVCFRENYIFIRPEFFSFSKF